MKIKIIHGVTCAVLVLFAGCSKQHSAVTGWNYNDPKNGGFEVLRMMNRKQALSLC